MAYLSLARKWRPQTFLDLIGQEHITQVLINALKANRIHSGYIFTGTRGIGKTTSARIFAKALRCMQAPAIGIPCNQCSDCREITEGKSVDVLEIDGASNNGVDAVRELREGAKFLPATGKYKIYIIDEVHMLTTAAFNALLKILEEPPAHVIFIFATTDVQKIPITVLSRCQRYDFKRVAESVLKTRLETICQKEGVAVESEALNLVVREAEGSVRDALSLLDQVFSVSTNSEKITLNQVTQSLGLVDKQTIFQCLEAILKKDSVTALEAAGRVYLHGFDLKQFGRDLLRALRQTMIAKILTQTQAPSAELMKHLEISDAELRDIQNLIGLRTQDDLDLLFRVLHFGLEDMARSQLTKIVFDITLLKMTALDDVVAVESVSDKNLTQPISVQPSPKPVFNQPVPTSTITNPSTTATAPTPNSASAQTVDDWARAVHFVKSQRPLIGSVLEHMSFENFSNNPDQSLTIKLGHTKDHNFYRDQLQSRAYNDLLVQLLKSYFNKNVKVDFQEVQTNHSLEQIAFEKKQKSIADAKKSVLESEVMKATQQLLGAKLEKLEIKGETTL